MMNKKKSDNVNLDLHRGTGFLLGLVIALALLFTAFEYTSRPKAVDEDESMLDDVAEDLAMTSAMDTHDMVSAAPAPASKAVTNNVKEVAHVESSDKIAPITSKLVIGQGEGVTKDANVVEALPQITAQSPDTAVLRTVEQMPEFPGGIVVFMKWLTKNLRYPKIAEMRKTQGKVIAHFYVEKDGSITGLKVVQSLSRECDKEALRVLGMMPNWQPGVQNGKPCRTKVSIPIVFKL